MILPEHYTKADVLLTSVQSILLMFIIYTFIKLANTDHLARMFGYAVFIIFMFALETLKSQYFENRK